MKKLSLFVFTALMLVLLPCHAKESTQYKEGKIKTLRVNKVGIVFGPANDKIAAEVIVKFANDNKAYGLQLRKDTNEIAHQGMLDLLRDAYINNLRVKLTYKIEDRSTKGRIIVVQLSK